MAKMIDMIKYEGSNEELFVKFRCDNLAANAQLIVPETHNAILIKDGSAMETYNSGRYDIFDTKKGFLGFGLKKTGALTVDVIYLSKGAKLEICWGTPNKFDFRDPVSDIAIEVGASGHMEVRIEEPRKAYIELIGALKSFSTDEFRDRLLNRIVDKIGPAIAKYLREQKLAYYQFEENREIIANNVFGDMKKIFSEYGIELCSFSLGKIFIPQDQKVRIEEYIQQHKEEVKEEEKRIRDKRELQEAMLELERLQDKEWEKEKYLRGLEIKNKELYLNVTREIGWESAGGKVAGKNVSGQKFCTKCGASYSNDAVFCSGCGERVNEIQLSCKACGAVISSKDAVTGVSSSIKVYVSVRSSDIL